MKNDLKIRSKNRELLISFEKYCVEHPDERFWQALRNWAKIPFLLAKFDEKNVIDTFYWKRKTERSNGSE